MDRCGFWYKVAYLINDMWAFDSEEKLLLRRSYAFWGCPFECRDLFHVIHISPFKCYCLHELFMCPQIVKH